MILRALLAIFTALLLAGHAEAANKFVRAGATGTGSGNNWTDAYTNLPTTLTRGDTYYVADGSYGSYDFDTPNSGTSTVTIKKCRTDDGVSSAAAGYSATYCDGQATFASIFLINDYLVFDGAGRNESNWNDGTAYGFRVTGEFHANGANYATVGSNITIRYADVGAADGTACSTTVSCPRGIYAAGFGKWQYNWLIERNRFHDTNVAMLLNTADGFTIQYNLIINSWNKEAIRGQGNTKNAVIRWNTIRDSCRGLPGDATAGGCTAQIAIWDSATPGSLDGTQVYGNSISTSLSTTHSDACILVGGNGGSLAGVSGNNVKVYNNTLYGVQSGQCVIIVPSVGTTGNEIRNNLWGGLGGGVSSGGTSANTITNNAVQNGIYANAAAGDLRLTADTSTTWFSLGAPFNVDMDGATRSSSIGAFQFAASSPPEAPTNFRLNIDLWLTIALLGLMGGAIWRAMNAPDSSRGGRRNRPAPAVRAG